MSASNDDFLSFSDTPANASAENTGGNNGNNKKFNPYFRKQNNQFNNWNRNQRGGDGGDRNFSPHRFNNERQNNHGQQRRYNNYNNQGGGGGGGSNRQHGRNNQHQRHNNGNNRKQGHGQTHFGNNTNNIALFFHPSMIEDPWKECYKFQINRSDKNDQTLNEDEVNDQDNEKCIDAEAIQNDDIVKSIDGIGDDVPVSGANDNDENLPISEVIENIENATG